MHELLRNAQADLAKADEIYRRRGNHHGIGNVDVNYAQICVELGDLDMAEKRASEAFDLAAGKSGLSTDVPGTHRTGHRCQCAF